MSRENKLYRLWRNALPHNRLDIEGQLYPEVQRYVRAIVFKKLGHVDPDLVQDIVWAVIQGLERFRGESLFTTWIYGIAKNQVNLHIRRLVRLRNESVEFHEDQHPQEPVDPTSRIALNELRKSLSMRDALLLQCKREDLTSEEVATKMLTTTKAVDSHWARLRRKLNKTSPMRRLVRGSGN